MARARQKPLMVRTEDGQYHNVYDVGFGRRQPGNVRPFGAQEFNDMVNQRGQFAGPYYAHSGREDRLMATVMELQHQLRVARGQLGAARREIVGLKTNNG